MEVVKKNLRVKSDPRGELIVAELGIDVPFEIKRVYFLKSLKSDLERGFHAHHELRQMMCCVSGELRVLLDDGKSKETVYLKSGETLMIENFVWHVMSSFSSDCVLAVFASDLYNESDYIRDYEQFLNALKK
jgi:dTDP-4-dehydrorhamnose 3,5-epimerase-like enzyme